MAEFGDGIECEFDRKECREYGAVVEGGDRLQNFFPWGRGLEDSARYVLWVAYFPPCDFVCSLVGYVPV